jgi:carbonic anhydrase/acetyltransferase-like protein (isoleucine patch superfamily)
MGSILLNGSRIGRCSVVGAGSVITEGKQFPEYSLIIGAPARVIKTLTPEQVAALGHGTAAYQRKIAHFKKGLKKIG